MIERGAMKLTRRPARKSTVIGAGGRLRTALSALTALLMVALGMALAAPPADAAGTTFTSSWNTTQTSTGSSAPNQIKLPLIASGNYSFVVDWGDGSTNTITSWNQAEVTHTYDTSGVKDLSIAGTMGLPRLWLTLGVCDFQAAFAAA